MISIDVVTGNISAWRCAHTSVSIVFWPMLCLFLLPTVELKHEYTQYNCGGTANCGAPQLRFAHLIIEMDIYMALPPSPHPHPHVFQKIQATSLVDTFEFSFLCMWCIVGI